MGRCPSSIIPLEKICLVDNAGVPYAVHNSVNVSKWKPWKVDQVGGNIDGTYE